MLHLKKPLVFFDLETTGISVVNDRIVRIGDINRSMLYQRMLTNTPNFRMPFKGRTVVDEEGLLLVEQWINSLTDCN